MNKLFLAVNLGFMSRMLLPCNSLPLFRLLFRALRISFLCLVVGSYTTQARCQSEVNDKSIRYQQERMVFLQWDQDKFTPTAGFLSLNPYYWLTWGLFYPSYHNDDRRPLSADGQQTQRLALVGAMNTTDNKYKLHSDTVKTTMLSEVAATSGTVTAADPLWLLYYKNQFEPLLDYSPASILGGLSPEVSAKLVSEGLYDWYTTELDRLKERINGAHDADMDRGSRILAYYRLLGEYKKLAGVWAIRTSTAAGSIKLTRQRQEVRSYQPGNISWTPRSDVEIARQVLTHLQ